MIRYALVCAQEIEFEAWFGSSDDYDRQVAAGQVSCPYCGAVDVRKQIMAPAVAGGAGEATMAAIAARIREHIRDTHDYVGDRFAAEARAMHAGEKDAKPIYGEATIAEAKALREDGVPASPLPPAQTPTPPKKLH